MNNIFVNVFTRFWWIWLGLGVIVTFIAIMLLSAGQSVWFDEGYSILLAREPVGELWALTAVDAHPPFYYLVLKAWTSLFGFDVWVMRALSAVCASLAIGAIFLTVRKLFTVKTALIVLPFLIMAPFALRYGYEIRMYALAALIGALATLVLVYAVQDHKRRYWVAYAILVALGMWTLYMMAALWLAHAAWLLLQTIRAKKNMFKQPWLYAYGLAVILFLPYIGTFLYQTFNSALPGIGTQLTLAKLSGALSALLTYQVDWQVSGLASLAILLVIGLIVYIHFKVWPRATKNEKVALSLLYCLAFVPFLFFAMTSLSKPIFVNRYMAHVALFFYLLLGVTVALALKYQFKKSGILLALISAVLLVSGVVTLQRTGNLVFERLQLPQTAQVREAVDCSDAVVVADDEYTYIDSAYYFNDCDLRFYSKNDIASDAGGYAPLHDSTSRIDSSRAVDSSTLVHLRWLGNDAKFVVDARYQLVETLTFDKQVVDTYRISAE
jgi:mannosyltransferase